MSNNGHDSPKSEQPPPVDGDPAVSPTISLTFSDNNGAELTFKLKRNTSMGKAMNAFSARTQRPINQLRFLFEGERLTMEDTADSKELEDGDKIEVHMEQIGGGDIKTSEVDDEWLLVSQENEHTKAADAARETEAAVKVKFYNSPAQQRVRFQQMATMFPTPPQSTLPAVALGVGSVANELNFSAAQPSATPIQYPCLHLAIQHYTAELPLRWYIIRPEQCVETAYQDYANFIGIPRQHLSFSRGGAIIHSNTRAGAFAACRGGALFLAHYNPSWKAADMQWGAQVA